MLTLAAQLTRPTSALLRAASTAFAARAAHTLPGLTYDYNALEPYISAEIMEVHHSKHHQTYVNNLNIAEAKLADAVEKNDVSAIISLESAIKFNGGGHINHSIFWTNLAPKSLGGGTPPQGELLADIEATFGSFNEFKDKFLSVTAAVQGSGWGWLGYDRSAKTLRIATCANQDPLEATQGLVPLLGIDVWEHAYYLQYKNVRPDYLNAIWEVINWSNVMDRYTAAKK